MSVHQLVKLVREPRHKLFYYKGHCGLEAAQYVSVHLPFYLLQQSGFFKALASPDRSEIERLLAESFSVINERFTKKAVDEVSVQQVPRLAGLTTGHLSSLLSSRSRAAPPAASAS